MTILNRPIPHNGVLESCYDGWHVYKVRHNFKEGSRYEVVLCAINRETGQKLKAVLTNDEYAEILRCFDWQELKELDEKMAVVEKRLGIDREYTNLLTRRNDERKGL